MPVLVLSLLIVLLSACGGPEHLLPTDRPQTNEQTGDLETVNFTKVSERIFQPHCIRCHDTFTSQPNVQPIADKILDSVLSDRMPKSAPPLDQELKDLLKAWVDAGAE